ncbi:MAG TPA: MarR family transcriptional regulator [Anaerolineaceae bacterium]|nr:MarR family transcriptional regulator [Anaerolineaceae bacterium]
MTKNHNLGYRLFLVSRAHHNQASRMFGEIGLFRGQPQVLFNLGDREGVTQTELAEKLELTPATLTNLLTRMEHSGLIERRTDALDSRCSRIFLTDAGRIKLAQAVEQTQKMDAAAFAGFNVEELTLLHQYLERIHQNLTRE